MFWCRVFSVFYKSLPGCRAYHDHSVQLNKDDWATFRLTVLAKKILKRSRYLLNIHLFVKFVRLSVKTVSEQRMNYFQMSYKKRHIKKKKHQSRRTKLTEEKSKLLPASFFLTCASQDRPRTLIRYKRQKWKQFMLVKGKLDSISPKQTNRKYVIIKHGAMEHTLPHRGCGTD